MKEIHSGSGELLLELKVADEATLCTPAQYPVYTVFLVLHLILRARYCCSQPLYR